MNILTGFVFAKKLRSVKKKITATTKKAKIDKKWEIDCFYFLPEGAVKKGLPLYKYIAELADNSEFSIPVPAFNVISGGRAAGNLLPCQEFMILPTGESRWKKKKNLVFKSQKNCEGAESFADAMKMGTEVYRTLEKMIAESQEAKTPLPVGDEGAFSPEFEEDREALSLINDAIKNAGYDGRVKIAIDMAASAFCKDGKKDFSLRICTVDPKRKFSSFVS